MAKPTTTKKAPAKRATTTNAPVKRTVSKKRVSNKPQSFRPARDTQPFTAFKVTEQTVYWLILTGSILLLGLWVTKINIQVQVLYDQIDENRIVQIEMDEMLNRIIAEKRIKSNQ